MPPQTFNKIEYFTNFTVDGNKKVVLWKVFFVRETMKRSAISVASKYENSKNTRVAALIFFSSEIVS